MSEEELEWTVKERQKMDEQLEVKEEEAMPCSGRL